MPHGRLRVEMDHTELDLYVIDDQRGIPLGRPTVTVIIRPYLRSERGTKLLEKNSPFVGDMEERSVFVRKFAFFLGKVDRIR